MSYKLKDVVWSIGVAGGPKRGMPPKKNFRKCSHFVLWEAFFQTK